MFDKFGAALLAVALALPAALPAAGAAAPPGAVIPFAYEENHLVIDVVIDGHPTRALFDTGGANVITPEYAKAIGLHTFGHNTARGAGEGSIEAQQADAKTIAVGPVVMHDQSVAVIPLPLSLRTGDNRPVEMIVGRELLQRYAARIDYAARTITLTPNATFAYNGTAEPVEMTLAGGTPHVHGSIDGFDGELQIDTGSSASLTVTSPFVAEHNLRTFYKTSGNVIMGRGVGGYTHGDLARAKLVVLGNVDVTDPVLELSTDRGGAFASRYYAANVGNDVLSRFTITFDYQHKKMYLERTAASATPPPYNRSGMYAQNDNRDFFDVVGMLPGGPADDAGLRPGDRIVSIDGKAARTITASEFWQLMRGPVGTEHALIVDRAGTTLTTTLTLHQVV